jgi:hypothetical protein
MQRYHAAVSGEAKMQYKEGLIRVVSWPGVPPVLIQRMVAEAKCRMVGEPYGDAYVVTTEPGCEVAMAEHFNKFPGVQVVERILEGERR